MNDHSCIEIVDNSLKSLQNEGTISRNDAIIEKCIDLLLKLIESDPLSLIGYQRLALICFFVREYKIALRILEKIKFFYFVLDSEYDDYWCQIDELQKEIEVSIGEFQNSEENKCQIFEDILDHGSRNLKKEISDQLTQIFAHFDANQNGYLDYDELCAYLRVTNNFEDRVPSNNILSPQLFKNIIEIYGEFCQHGLSLSGFIEFYADQSKEHPEETIKDIAKCQKHIKELPVNP